MGRKSRTMPREVFEAMQSEGGHNYGGIALPPNATEKQKAEHKANQRACFGMAQIDDTPHNMGIKKRTNPTLGLVDLSENARLRKAAKRKAFVPSGSIKPKCKVAEREPNELPANGMYVTGRPAPHGDRPQGYVAIGKR